MARDFELILEQIGKIGPFQVLLTLVMQLQEFALAWGLLIMTVAGTVPEWRCPGANDIASEIANSSSVAYMLGFSNVTDSNQYCPADGGVCPNVTFSKEVTSVVSEWKLICDRQWAVGIAITVQMLGVMLGANCAGQLSDMFGRKKLFFFAYSLLIVNNFLSAFSVSIEMYTAFRFFIGVGIGGLMYTNIIINVEYVGVRYRTYIDAPPFWAMGQMVMAGLAYVIRDWKMLAITVSAMGAPYVVFWWFVPESARWLMTKGRYVEAQAILCRIAKFNKRPAPSLDQMETLRNIAQEDIKLRSEERRYSFIDLFRSIEYAKKRCLLLVLWFSYGAVYYGLSFGVMNLSGDRYLNLVLSAAAELPTMVFLFINNRFGRRYTIVLCLGLTTVCSVAIAIMHWTGGNHGHFISIVSMVARLCTNGGWGVLVVFTVEHYPTVVRNIGMAMCQNGGRIGSVIAPLLIELHTVSPSMPYIVFAVLSAASTMAAILLEETKGKHMLDFLPPRKRDTTSKDDELKVEGGTVVDF